MNPGTVLLVRGSSTDPEEVKAMPLAQIKVIEGVFSEAEKKQMIEKVTDALVSIEGETLREKTVVKWKNSRAGIGDSAASLCRPRK